MSTVILSAASPANPGVQELGALLQQELARTETKNVHRFDLAAIKLAYCQGEFDCWVKTPGVCRSLDAEQDIVRAIHDAENLIFLDAVTFGGHSYTLKRAQDRLICLLAPFFEKRSLLTHHDSRYEKNPNFFALGFSPTADEYRSETWRGLADANAINMLAPRVGSAVVSNADRDGWATAIRTMLASEERPGSRIQERESLRAELLLAAKPEYSPFALVPAQKVAFVIGSAKPKGTSTSETLARAMGARFEKEGVSTEYHFATDFLHEAGAAAAAGAVAAADLFVLVSPLYVDSLPALATRALEHVARARTQNPNGRKRFAALLNCGFPEPEHNRSALRIARHFAEDASYHFAGGLPLGGGGMIKPGVPLDEQHGPAEHVKRALDAATAALSLGENIPPEALMAIIETPFPDSAYRLMGDLGWRYQAYKNGVAQGALRARPFD